MSNSNQPTRKQAREQAREQARLTREKAAKKKRLTKFGVIGAIVLVAFAAVGGTVYGVMNQTAPTPAAFPDNMRTDGAIFTASDAALEAPARTVETPREAATGQENYPTAENRVHVTVYMDYSCPHCATFEAATADMFDQMLDEGLISLELKPVNVLNGGVSASGANAAACLIDTAPNTFLDFNEQLFTFVTENGGFADERDINGIVRGLGLTGAEEETITSCINDDTYGSWVEYASNSALENVGDSANTPLQGTPAILVNGELFTEGADPQALQNRILELANGGPATPVEPSAAPEEEIVAP